MTDSEQRCLHLSASAITSFKACPTRFRNAYVEGLRPIEETKPQRVGTNWHGMHETYRLNLALHPHEAAFEAALTHLNDVYTRIPDGFNAHDWEIERTILAMSFAAYHWYYQNDPINVVLTEKEFTLPLRHPKTNLPLSVDRVIRVGKIDTVMLREGRLYIGDYKSTSKSLDADSQFWDHLRLDTQISMYVCAADELLKSGEWEKYGLTRDMNIEGAFYDVWHKPTLEPSTLTQASTKLLVETKTYLDQKYEVEVVREWEDTAIAEDGKESTSKNAHVKVNGQDCTVIPGKKAYAVRETPAMYGARLLADIYERPQVYFRRHEIARTGDDRKRFLGQLYNVYQSMVQMRDSRHWYMNELQCHATFTCAYASLCPHNVDVTNGQTPAGFKRIFTSLTLNNENMEL